MSDKEHCPVCDSYTSSLYASFQRGEDCPHCGASFKTILKLEDIKLNKEKLKRDKMSEDLIQRNELLEKQNTYLLEELKKIEDGIWTIHVAVDDFQPKLEKWYESIIKIKENIK